MHTVKKTKTQVTRICPSTLQYIVLSPGFTCVHTELQLHSHHFSHCCKYIQIPWPLLPPLYIPGKTPTVGTAGLWGQISWLLFLQSQTCLCLSTALSGSTCQDSSCAFPFFTPFHPPLPIHSQLTLLTCHCEIRSHYVISLICSPPNLSLGFTCMHLLLFPQRKSICPPPLGLGSHPFVFLSLVTVGYNDAGRRYLFSRGQAIILHLVYMSLNPLLFLL